MVHSIGAEGTERPLTAAEITEIITSTDGVSRNLRITHAYHQLSGMLRRLLGHRDANWCVFGTWASRTVGGFVRGELKATPLLPPLLPVPGWAGRRLMSCAAPHVAVHLGQGNLLVFRELAPLFLTMATAYAEEDDRERALARVLATLTPGPLADGGQDLLIAGVRSYHRAMSLPSSPLRAQAILLGNLQISLHEQTRLQEAIAGSLTPPLRVPFTPAPVRALFTRMWCRLATSHLMDLHLPAPDFATSRVLVPLRLGRDVGGAPGGADFPEPLADLTDTELKALLYDLDRSPDSLLGSAAGDWSVLAERMNYLADLFRLWQQEPCLLQAPFTDDQAGVIRAGKVPDGPPPL